MKSEIENSLKQSVHNALKDANDITLPSVIVERPRNLGHGDFATNIAMLLAGILKRKPREIADDVIKGFECKYVKKCEIAGPGFINFFLKDTAWQNVLNDVSGQGGDYGRSTIGGGKTCNLEFVSANPTGPLHIGHGRGAVVGDVLANVLDFAGFKVCREYYINDFGNQIVILGHSMKARYLEELGKEFTFPEGGYPGSYLTDIAKEIVSNDADSLEDKDPAFFSALARGKILDMIKVDLAYFRVSFDNWYSERKLHDTGEVTKAIDKLKEQGVIYEDDSTLWLNSTKYGDEKDRVVVRKSGEPTYLASDIAYHRDKFERKFESVVNIWGADHHGYIPRIKSVIDAMGYDSTKFRVILIQMVNLMRDGKPVAMGKREGEFITLREVLDEVGVDAARFFFLERKSDAHLNFDLTLAKEQSNNNPVYYIQYAHARICSILRKAEEKNIDTNSLKDANVFLLSGEKELEIMKKIDTFREIVELIASTFEPHHLTFYLKELVGMFHAYYYDNPILSDDKELSRARLRFVLAIRQVIRNGLKLLNIEAPERM